MINCSGISAQSAANAKQLPSWQAGNLAFAAILFASSSTFFTICLRLHLSLACALRHMCLCAGVVYFFIYLAACFAVVI